MTSHITPQQGWGEETLAGRLANRHHKGGGPGARNTCEAAAGREPGAREQWGGELPTQRLGLCCEESK